MGSSLERTPVMSSVGALWDFLPSECAVGVPA